MKRNLFAGTSMLALSLMASHANATAFFVDGLMAQTFTAPDNGTYEIVAYGAQGGKSSTGYSGGAGSKAVGDFTLTAGTVLDIAVGNHGYISGPGSDYGAGGGGASAVVIDGQTVPLVVGGGGGGAGRYGPGSYRTRKFFSGGGRGGKGYGNYGGGGGGGAWGGEGYAAYGSAGGKGGTAGLGLTPGGSLFVGGGGGGGGGDAGGGGGGYHGGFGGSIGNPSPGVYNGYGGEAGSGFVNGHGTNRSITFNQLAGAGYARGAYDGYVTVIELTSDTAMPEPASSALIVSGLGALGLIRRRRR